jgi:hypothetical protein
VSIYDPYTTRQAAGGAFERLPFAGNILPQSRIDPVAAKIMSYLPPPNRPGEGPAQINNWVYAPKETTQSDQWSVRLDHRFSDSHNLFGRVTRNKGLDTNTGEYGTLADSVLGAIENHAWNAVLNGTLLLAPTRIGWSVSGTASFVTGFPVWLTATGNSGVFSSILRPNSTGKSAELSGTVQSRLTSYFDTSQFTVPAPFTFGNVSRTLPDVRAPGRRNYDLALTKSFRVREPVSLLFRAETFNLTNTPYFGGVNSIGSNPGNNLGSPTFGVITDATGERQVQFSLKVVW